MEVSHVPTVWTVICFWGSQSVIWIPDNRLYWKGDKVAHVRTYLYMCLQDYTKWATHYGLHQYKVNDCTGMQDSSWARCPQMEGHWKKNKRGYIGMSWTKLNVGFAVLTVVVVKSTIFWDITLCSLLSVNRRFVGIYRLHLQGRKISWARNQCESTWKLAQLIFRS
jgi:hypothetical protein